MVLFSWTGPFLPSLTELSACHIKSFAIFFLHIQLFITLFYKRVTSQKHILGKKTPSQINHKKQKCIKSITIKVYFFFLFSRFSFFTYTVVFLMWGEGHRVYSGKEFSLQVSEDRALEYNVSQSLLHCVFSLGDLQSSSEFTRAWRDSVALQIRACQPYWRCINVRGEKYISCHFRLQTAFYFLPFPTIPSSFLLHRKVINLQQRHGLPALPCARRNRPDF